MQLHQIKPIHKSKKTKRVGRGGVHGSHCGHGTKGQRGRAGRRFKPVIRELIKRYPKLRGYRQKIRIQKAKLETVVLNIEILEKRFAAGDKVNPQTLLEKKIIDKIEGRMPKVKILGKGEITKALAVEDCKVSKPAKEAIEKAGGTVK
jgi:large subunit ribosomal protein L15